MHDTICTGKCSADKRRNAGVAAGRPGGRETGAQGWGKDARLWPTVSPSPVVPAASILRPRLPSPAHLRRLYLSLDGRPGHPNSQHDELHHFGNINMPISASISRESIDTRSISPVNSGRRTLMALGVYGVPSQEASGICNTTMLRSRRRLRCSFPWENF